MGEPLKSASRIGANNGLVQSNYRRLVYHPCNQSRYKFATDLAWATECWEKHYEEALQNCDRRGSGKTRHGQRTDAPFTRRPGP